MSEDPYLIDAKVTAYRPMRGGEPVVFRSVLEARWAYAFDALHLPWEYEPVTLRIPAGIGGAGGWTYLPDFYLAGIGFIEIKPSLETLTAVQPKLSAIASVLAEITPQGLVPALYSIDAEAPAFTVPARGTARARGSVIEWTAAGVRPLSKPEARALLCAPDATDFRREQPEAYADHVDRVLAHAVRAVREAMGERDSAHLPPVGGGTGAKEVQT